MLKKNKICEVCVERMETFLSISFRDLKSDTTFLEVPAEIEEILIAQQETEGENLVTS